jgi:hypothetical protein
MTPTQKTALDSVRFTVDAARNTGLTEDEIIKAIKEPIINNIETRQMTSKSECRASADDSPKDSLSDQNL